MYHRTGRALVVTALVAASAGVAAVASSASAAPVAKTPAAGTAAAPRTDRSAFARSAITRGLSAGSSEQVREAAAEPGPPPAPVVPKPPYPFKVTKLTTDVFGPFNVAVDAKKRVYVAEGFMGALLRLGDKKPLFTAPVDEKNPYDVTGVDVLRNGTYAFTWGSQPQGKGYLTIRPAKGKAVRVDVGAYERKYNPDKRNNYGAQTDNPCALAAFDFTSQGGPPAKYTGQVDTHAYAVTAVPGGGWVVADAGGNTLVVVTAKGKVKTAYALPPVPVVITKELAAAQNLPECTVGVTYNFEAVPTDVEYAHGKLYVSTLSGGPEGPGAATGAAWSVGLDGKNLKLLGSGFSGATNLAVTPSGAVLVAELGGHVSRVVKGKPAPLFTLPNALAVEYSNGSIYASQLADVDFMTGKVNSTGSVVRYDVKW